MKSWASLSGGRYRSLVISICIFLGLIALLLAFTFFTSNLLARNAVLMNETSRVSNSAQAIIKDLFDLQNSWGEDVTTPHMQAVLQRLSDNTQIISSRLQVLNTGGVVLDSAGNEIDLPAVATSESLKNAQYEWTLLEPKIQLYLSHATNLEIDSLDALTQAVNQARTSSLLIDESFSALASGAVQQADNQAATIRLIQLIGVAIILVYFLIFVFFFIRRLRTADEETEVARQETAEILQTVNTGLFLLDKDLTIGQQYSSVLESIVGAQELAGKKLTSLLRNRISDRDLRVAEQFIEQLYNPKTKEKLIQDLNPLHKVMMQNSHDSKTRYLDFKFSRVYENKQIKRILVNVNDVSDAVLLEQNLEKERAHNDMQIEMLTTILNVSPHIINEFITNTYAHIQRMNDVLKNPGSSQSELEDKLRLLYREMHSLKGEASALKLSSFTKIATEAEDKLHILQKQSRLSGNDFLALTVHLDELLTLSNVIAGLGQRINSNHVVQDMTKPMDVMNAMNPLQMNTQEQEVVNLAKDSSSQWVDIRAEFADYLVNFGKDIAKRQNKEVDIDVSKLAPIKLDKKISMIVREICVQLLRNSIVHGIENSSQREALGKSSKGRVIIAGNMQNDDGFVFYVEDDGRGIDYDMIRNQLMDRKQMDADKIASLSNIELLNMIFKSGFSTKSTADEDGGRGVGLDIVKDRVKMAGGKIVVDSEKNQFCRFTIKLPIQSN